MHRLSPDRNCFSQFEQFRDRGGVDCGIIPKRYGSDGIVVIIIVIYNYFLSFFT